jgi:methyl-accepting chemotaxis protein
MRRSQYGTSAVKFFHVAREIRISADLCSEGFLSMANASPGNADPSKTLAENLHAEADQIMVGVLWLLWLVSLGFCFLYGTWMLWAVAATAISTVGTLLWKLAPASVATRLTIAASFMVYSALLIHQAHGATESHFGVFVLLSFLLYYRDWRPIVMAAIAISVHHASFYFLQAAGAPVFVFEHANMVSMVFVHVAYVAFESLVLVLMAVKLCQETEEAATLASLGASIDRSGEIDLDPSRVEAAGAAGHGVAIFLDTIHHALREASVVAVAIRQASSELRSAGAGMVTIRDQQQVDVQQVEGLIEAMHGVADKVAHDSRSIAGEAGECAHIAEGARQGMDATARSIETLVRSVQQTAEQMMLLDEATARIETIVGMIDGIAGQTNLLALNASIEAARAGEAGRGFAVVAGEVRRLSESTQNSAKQIQEVVGGVRQAALNARQVAETSRAEAESGGDRMRSATMELESIVSRLPIFASGMNQLSSEMAHQQAMMQEITNHLAGISSILRDSAGRVESIHSSGQSLDTMSERLYDSVRRFRKGEERFVA